MKRILFIDDSTASQMIVRRILGPGYSFTAVDTPTKGLSLAQSQEFDLLITDFHFPQDTALEMIIRLRQRKSPSELPIIAASCSMDNQLKAHLHKFGVNACIQKPFARDALSSLVQRMLESNFVEEAPPADSTVCAFEWFFGGEYHQYCPELNLFLRGED
jgi:CheY-like chemotaxis protein